MFGRRSAIAQKEIIEGGMWFNDEELFFMNRIIYSLFRKCGSKLRFDLFLANLDKLHSSSFDTRLMLWL